MSQTAAAKFMDKLDKDKKLRDELKASKGNFQKLAKKHRLSFTGTELKAHLIKRWGVKKPARYDDPDLTCF
jgi:Nif11 domain